MMAGEGRVRELDGCSIRDGFPLIGKVPAEKYQAWVARIRSEEGDMLINGHCISCESRTEDSREEDEEGELKTKTAKFSRVFLEKKNHLKKIRGSSPPPLNFLMMVSEIFCQILLGEKKK